MPTSHHKVYPEGDMPMNGDDQTKLLAEIRDTLQEQLQVLRDNRVLNEKFMQIQSQARRKMLRLLPVIVMGSAVLIALVLNWLNRVFSN